MFPINDYQAIAYRHGDPTFYNDFHLGTDFVCPIGTPIYMPFDGKVAEIQGKQGGLTAYVFFKGLQMRCMHLSKVVRVGKAREGELIAYSGNSGLSTAPHVHLDLCPKGTTLSDRDKFIDPMTFVWDNDTMDYKKLYEEEKEKHKESITVKKQNYDKWQEEIEKRQLCQQSHEDTLEKYLAESKKLETERQKNRELRKKYNQLKDARFEGMTFREKFKILFGY